MIIWLLNEVRQKKRDVFTCEKHENGRAGDVARSSAPTADDSSPKGNKVKEEGHDEESDHGASHI
jgi:hypothetical protein